MSENFNQIKKCPCGKMELHKADESPIWKMPPMCFNPRPEVEIIPATCPECSANQVVVTA
jgi:hypothetical protein